MLEHAHDCAKTSKVASTTEFEDGTLRRSMGASNQNGEAAPFDHGEASEACERFDQSSQKFRDLVTEVSNSFVERLDAILDIDEPLLRSAENEESFATITDIVAAGKHLEHFHSYQRIHDTGSASAQEPHTIDYHTDQGLFIAFTPAHVIDEVKDKPTNGAGEFFIQFQDGSAMAADFLSDELIFMLGDGVNQYVNKKCQSGPPLRATPHALRMPSQSASEFRLWFGRMVLPPGTCDCPPLVLHNSASFHLKGDVLVRRKRYQRRARSLVRHASRARD